ncbi:hypothetical protein [Nocardia crassostreae]|uniref:hypothetical protein n=1 Tax=Nocardia crassostreae TaxID=53428 RepID=UPI000829F5AC|nr:hypothetical protein [Nocardia crassostreae]
MRLAHVTLIAATPVLIAGLAACGNSSDSAKSTTTATTVATTTIATTTTSAAPAPPPVTSTAAPVTSTTGPAPTPPPTTTPAPEPVEDVDCGPVTDAGGGTRTVIAVGTPAGRVGCTEAINVATKYVQTISDTDVATIDGWSCNAQPDAEVPSMCAKDGLLINLRAN